MLKYYFTNSKYFPHLLATIIFIGHVIALVSFGATFWVDSILYLDMAHYMSNGIGLTGFYSPIKMCIASHFPPFPALLWAWLYPIFSSHTWLIFAILQRLLAGVALFYLIMAIQKYLNRVILLIATVILLLYPYYESFHNMVMTESIASSTLMMMMGSTLYLVSGKKNYKLHLFSFTVASFLGIQTRPQMILFALSLLAIQVFTLRKNFLKYILPLVVIILGYFVFPFGRFFLTGQFFLPNIQCLGVRSALMSHIGQEDETAIILSKYDRPPEIDPIKASTEGLSYEQSLAWKIYLNNKGLNHKQVNRMLGKIAREIRFSNIKGILSEVDSALSGVGLLNISIFHIADDILSEGKTKAYWTKHYTVHYKWLSWTSEADHREIFDDFLGRFKVSGLYDPEVIKMMNETISPYISKSRQGRDLLGLSSIPTDFWFIGWLFGTIYIYLYKSKILAAILTVPTVVNYFVVLFVGFGNIRYFYVAAPFEVIVTLIVLFYAIAWFRKKLMRLDETGDQ